MTILNPPTLATELMIGAKALVPAAVVTVELAVEHTSAPFQFLATT